MQKIVNRRPINLKFLVFFIILFSAVVYFISQQFYNFEKREKLELISYLIEEKKIDKSNNEIKNFIRNFEVNQEIILLKVKILQLKKEQIDNNYLDEIIKLIFVLKSFYSNNQQDFNLLLGKIYYEKGVFFFQQSKFYLEKYLANQLKNKFNFKIFSLLYEINLKLNIIESAFFYIEQLVIKNPESLDLRIKLIDILILNKKNLKAKKLLEELVLVSEFSPFTFKIIKLLFETLNELNLEKKISFYHDFIINKFKDKKEFIKNYREFFQNLKKKKE